MPSPQAVPTGSVEAPTPIEIVESPVNQDLPSSPPPLPEEPQFEMDITYIIRVNGSKTVEDHDSCERIFFFLSLMEDKIMALIESPASTIDGRIFKWESRNIGFRPDKKGASWQYLLLSDFSSIEEVRLFQNVDRYISRFKDIRRVEFKMEVRLRVEALPVQKAFPRNRSFNESLSEQGDDNTTGTAFGHRTKQLLKETKAMERVKEIESATDHQSTIHQMWECRVDGCDNYGHWCYVHPSGAHYEVRRIDAEAWARSIVKGQSTANLPHIDIIEALKLRGNKLRINPHSRKGKKKRQDSSSDSDGPSLKRLAKQAEKRRIMEQMARMDEEAVARAERRDFQQFQMQQMRLQQLPGTLPGNYLGRQQPPTYYPALTTAAPQALRPETPPAPKAITTTSSSIPVLSSSPVAEGVREDTRIVVKDFFAWLIEQQPEDDMADHITASKVAIEQKWTIKDLRTMSDPDSKLYDVAVSRFHLKDGVVRHFRDDLRRFKQVYRTASGLLELGGVGGNE